MKKSYFLFLFLISKILFLTSCANIIPPTGGLKDTLPPVLIAAKPTDSALNFKTNKITLEFNEYIQLDNDWLNKVIVSPYPDQSPSIQSKLQTVSIRMRDSLKPNTTYAINFGNTLKDVNEGNAYKNFTYVFSTGNKLDDGKISGQVILAETGAVDSTLIVILHTNLNDTAVKKDRPLYFTRLDGGGNFEFNFLPRKQYNIYAVPDDYSKKYDDSTKFFAFLNAPVSIDSSNTSSLTLYAYQQYKKTEKIATTPSPSKPVKGKDTTKGKTLNYAIAIEGGQQTLLKNIEITFDSTVAAYDSSKIILTDTNYHPIIGYTLSRDTSLKKFYLKYPWKEGQHFKLIIQPNAFTDSAGEILAKADTITFSTRTESTYGSIRYALVIWILIKIRFYFCCRIIIL
ncbi:MAG: Ig-like domain-containing protein [Parafilimonas sp.]